MKQHRLKRHFLVFYGTFLLIGCSVVESYEKIPSELIDNYRSTFDCVLGCDKNWISLGSDMLTFGCEKESGIKETLAYCPIRKVDRLGSSLNADKGRYVFFCDADGRAPEGVARKARHLSSFTVRTIDTNHISIIDEPTGTISRVYQRSR